MSYIGVPSNNIVYFSIKGSDTNGDGSFLNPFKSYDQCITYIQSLPNAPTALYQYCVTLLDNFDVGFNFNILPFINIQGYGAQATIHFGDLAGRISLDASYANNGTTVIKDLRFTTAPAANLLFGALTGCQIIFDNINWNSISTGIILTATSDDTNTSLSTVKVLNCQYNKCPIIDFTNVSLSYFDNSFFTSGSPSISSVCSSTVAASVINTISNITNGGAYDVTISSSNSGLNQLNIQNSSNLQLTIDGVNTTVYIDPTSYFSIPTFTGGATIAQVNLLSLSDGVNNTSFTPANYTPVGSSSYTANSVTGNLNGIDNALGSIVSSIKITNIDNSMSPYTVLASDDWIEVDSSGGAITILMEDAPVNGRFLTIMDATGSSFAHNITITTVSGTDLINGATSQVYAFNYQGQDFLFNSTYYSMK